MPSRLLPHNPPSSLLRPFALPCPPVVSPSSLVPPGGGPVRNRETRETRERSGKETRGEEHRGKERRGEEARRLVKSF